MVIQTFPLDIKYTSADLQRAEYGFPFLNIFNEETMFTNNFIQYVPDMNGIGLKEPMNINILFFTKVIIIHDLYSVPL